jgi:hypothetical protein
MNTEPLMRFEELSDEGARQYQHLVDNLGRNNHFGLCRHQVERIAPGLFDAIAMGSWLKTKAADVEALGLTMLHPIDGTAEQDAGWLVNFVRFHLWRDRGKCRHCGHVATGALAKWTEDWATATARRRGAGADGRSPGFHPGRRAALPLSCASIARSRLHA